MTCSIIECEKSAACKKHRGNQGRSLNKRNGYVILTDVVHHLTGMPPGMTGKVYEHRMVLWNKLECETLECVHPCHWCGKELNWKTMRADHVDSVRTNNHSDNLVPSCNSCNIGRARLSKVNQPEGAASE